jgi:hypothetical protein
MSNKIEVVRTPPTKKSPEVGGFIVEFHQTLKENYNQ